MSADIKFSVDIQNGAQIAARLLGYGGYLETEMYLAMDDIVQMMIPVVQGNMHWMHPTGDLESSIDEDSRVIDAWHAEIGSSLPYAARREWGFSGMTDSLGRYYADDPGAYYLSMALTDHQSDIQERINYAVMSALNPLGI